MQPSQFFAALRRNHDVFQSLLQGLPEEMYNWKPAPEKWNLLQVVCHLRDEEREDFRARVKFLLEQPGTEMPSIDPVGWVVERKYAEQDYEATLIAFLEERTASVAWLEALQDPNWDNSYDHPRMGRVTAAFFLHNWLAHDHHHIRQVNRICYEYLQAHSGENLGYAGNW